MAQITIRVGQKTTIEGPLGSVARFKTSQVQELLAYLAKHHPTPCQRGALISHIWPNVAITSARNSLSVALNALRTAFSEVGGDAIIHASRAEVWLQTGAVTISEEVTEAHGQILPRLRAEEQELVGRATEIARLLKLLSDPKVRLVSIVGLGGLGKTVLARAALDRINTSRVVFIEMQEAPNEVSFAHALGSTLGLGAGTDLSETLKIASSIGPYICVLDAMEYFAADAVKLVDKLLRSNAKVLVTSRHRIGMKDEYLLRLSALSCQPSSQNGQSSACLMLLRCLDRHGVDPAIVPDTDAESICQRLDGIPIAIEWSAVILAFHGKNALFRALDNCEVGELPWQAVLAWTFRNVSEKSRRLWLLLACCMCPLSSEVINFVVGKEGLEDAVSELTGYGVIHTEMRGDRPYFRMLDTLSSLALKQAGASQLLDAEKSLTDLWCVWTDKAGADLRGPTPEGALEEAATMLPAILHAMRCAPAKTWIRMFLNLHPFFHVFGIPPEVVQLAHRLYSVARDLDAIDNALMAAVYACCMGSQSPDRLLSASRSAMELAFETKDRDTLLIVAGLTYRPDPAGSWDEIVQRAIDSGRMTPWAVMSQFQLLSNAASGHPVGIEERLEWLLQLVLKTKFRLMEHSCNGEIGYALLSRSRFADAEERFRRAASLRQSYGYGNDGAFGLIALCRSQQGDFDEAISLHKRILSAPHSYLDKILRTHTSIRLLAAYFDALYLEQAEAEWDSLVDTIREAPDEFSEIQIRLLKATHCRLRGLYLEALHHIQWARNALTSEECARYRRDIGGRAICDEALCESRLGRPEKCRTELLLVLENALSDHKPALIIRAMDALAFTHWSSNNRITSASLLAGGDLICRWTGIRRSPAQIKQLADCLAFSSGTAMTVDDLIDLMADTLRGLRMKQEIIEDLQLQSQFKTI